MENAEKLWTIVMMASLGASRDDKKADSMAALRTLLLNKELEDWRIITKVMDESGLKFTGKEAAAKADGLLVCQQIRLFEGLVLYEG